jgi:hypothetical protein
MGLGLGFASFRDPGGRAIRQESGPLFHLNPHPCSVRKDAAPKFKTISPNSNSFTQIQDPLKDGRRLSEGIIVFQAVDAELF